MSFCDPQIERIPQRAISIQFPPCCNSLLSKNTRRNCFIYVWIKIVLIVHEYFFLEKRWYCVFRHNPRSPKICKMLSILIHIVIQTDFPQQLLISISSWESQTANLHLKTKFDSTSFQSLGFFASKSGHSRKTKVFLINLCRYSTSNFFLTTVLSSSGKVSIKSLTPSGENSTGISLILTPASKSWQSKIVIENDSSEVSKRFFSITTGLRSFVRVTIKNFSSRTNVLVEISIKWFFASKSEESQMSMSVFLMTYVEIQSRISL